MKQTFPLALALTAGLAACAQARTPNGVFQIRSSVAFAAIGDSRQAQGSVVQLHEGQRVVVIGEISSDPKKVAGVKEEHKMQVAVGPGRTDYTLHLGDAQLFDVGGRKIETDDLGDKSWVRAEGTVMDDPRRIKVSRLRVIGKNQRAYRTSRFYRRGSESGFIVALRDPARPVGGQRTPLIAADARAVPRLAEGTPVVIVGEITSQPKDIVDEDKMQVAIGPGKTDFTLHLSDAKMQSFHGTPIEEDKLENKMWVRAEGTVMDDPRRIKVSRLQVIGKDMPSLQRSAFYRPGFDQGYVVAVAGTRQIFPETQAPFFTPGPLVIVGKVSDDTGPLETTRKIQMDAAGNTWTIHVPKDTPIFDTKGEKISVHEIGQGQWVRVHGWQTDDLRMRGARIENIGPEEAFRASAVYREAEPMGYVERMPGTGVQFNPLKTTGVITAIDQENGTFTLRDDQGRDRVFIIETLTVFENDRLVDPTTLKQGQRVTVQGSEISF